MSNLPHVREFVFGQPWAVTDKMLPVIADIVERHLSGESTIAADNLRNTSATSEVKMENGLAIVDISGVLMQRAQMFERISGAVSYPRIESLVRQAIESEARAVVLRINSPGGEVWGCEACAKAIAEVSASSDKMVISWTDREMCSAAYWLGCQTNLVLATPDAVVGSVGVIATVADTSRAEKNLGLERKVIRSGPNKAVGQGPVTDEQLDAIREMVAQYSESFWSSVSRARGVELSAEIKSGRTWTGTQAVAAGLVDETMTFNELISKYGAGS
jgi:capsid assembly protease